MCSALAVLRPSAMPQKLVENAGIEPAQECLQGTIISLKVFPKNYSFSSVTSPTRKSSLKGPWPLLNQAHSTRSSSTLVTVIRVPYLLETATLPTLNSLPSATNMFSPFYLSIVAYPSDIPRPVGFETVEVPSTAYFANHPTPNLLPPAS